MENGTFGGTKMSMSDIGNMLAASQAKGGNMQSGAINPQALAQALKQYAPQMQSMFGQSPQAQQFGAEGMQGMIPQDPFSQQLPDFLKQQF